AGRDVDEAVTEMRRTRDAQVAFRERIVECAQFTVRQLNCFLDGLASEYIALALQPGEELLELTRQPPPRCRDLDPIAREVEVGLEIDTAKGRIELQPRAQRGIGE